MHDVPIFDRFAPVYDLFLPGTDAAPLAAGLELAERPVKRVVDLGGGTGRAGRAVSPETIIFDASRPMLEQARKNGFETIRGDARSIPLPAESIDAMVSVDALHHLPSIDGVLAEVHRILRPGGVFVLRDFDPTTIRGRGLALGERLVGFESTFLSASSISAALEAAGFTVQTLETGFVYTVVGRVKSV
ncbi:menaquinone biosynthesis methyltransferase UbiE [Halodesulfurarchaeum formicicum]|uniref:Demethylmenaquinone methyltransferase / 2-methoxy-6-polyprenyl-1,4-benzoquinol methylase n=1 Tax=Halodesulfurarchaeum formicicum TaxID=1873524 RepID=A0A1D8S4I6_9EURY|nr:class I SAM-dependent methyltransferase [Halodesulfurarchaeum formicicum]AOW80263.1 menaquinone biosynthesis methyltransferase UbiE [Halodesulfurarchaeum formicicum]APE95568.1 demethylmenaquinone methyltransferase / 2-methoxy-6-polyprenyl-1,4-benzoquinol methylase [Halodesulfurarchaeum formicicum]